MSLQSYRDLEVWQLAIELVENVYRLSRQFPRRNATTLSRKSGVQRFLFPRTLPKATDDFIGEIT